MIDKERKADGFEGLAHPFDSDDDKFKEECGLFGVFGAEDAEDAAKYVAMGLHALQHRGHEAAGIVSCEPSVNRFHQERRHGLVHDKFTEKETLKRLPGSNAVGHTRYSTAGEKGESDLRDIQPLFAELSNFNVALAHNGNLTNAGVLRKELVSRSSIFQSGSDTECVIHLMARSNQISAAERLQDALRRVEGAYSVIALTRDEMIGVRDPMGLRPLVIGRVKDAWVMASETTALDVVDADFIREVEPGEMVIINKSGLHSERPFRISPPSRFCVFEYVYFSRPDSVHGGQSVYEVRRRIGQELAREAPVDADLVVPIPDSGIPAALGFSREAGIDLEFAITRNQYRGRTFIEPTDKARNQGVRLKHNINRRMVEGKRVILVDDSVVRGTTTKKIKELMKDAGAKEVHFRIASPPTQWPCFYGVDTPQREKLLAASMSLEEMRRTMDADSLAFVSLDGLYRACGVEGGRDDDAPRFCDACFSGEYPINPIDARASGELPPIAKEADET